MIVVDTGFGFGHPELDQSYDVRARRILDALAGIEVRPADVTAILNCHLHADHAGQNLAFPQVPIVVQPVEWRLAHDTDHTILEWVDFEGADIRPTPGDHEVRPRSGSSRRQGTRPATSPRAVDTADGLVVLAGQACYTTGEWAGDPDALRRPNLRPRPGRLRRLDQAPPRAASHPRPLRPDRQAWLAEPGR